MEIKIKDRRKDHTCYRIALFIEQHYTDLQEEKGLTDTTTYRVASLLNNKINFSAESDAFSFEDFITGSFSAQSFNGSWWSANQLQWSDKVGPIVYNSNSRYKLSFIS